VPPDASPALFVLGHEDVDGGLRALLWLSLLVLLPLTILWAFGLDHPRQPLFSYDDLLALGLLGLRWPNQDLVPFELDHIHIHWKQVLVELYLGTFYKF
jgi:hypothetical protein